MIRAGTRNEPDLRVLMAVKLMIPPHDPSHR